MSRKMKDSGVAWIGEIPESWSDALLSSILSERKNKNKDMQEENLLSLSYGNIIRKNIDTTDGLLPASFEGYNIIERGDIVLRLTDLQNDHRSLRTGLCKERGIITSAYTTLKQESDKHDSRYLHYYLHCFDLCKGFYGMGDGVRQGLSYDGIRKIPLLLPDKNEEKEIADFIDKKCSQIDALISNQQKQIEKLKTYKHSVITEVVTKGLNPDAEMKDSGVEWIGEIPKDWNYQKSFYVCEKIGDIDHYMPKNVVEGYPYVMTGDLQQNVSEIDFDKCKQISEDDYRQLSKKIVPTKGDILFARYATIGTVCYVDVDKEFLVSYSCVTIKPKRNVVEGKYLWYYYQSITFLEEVKKLINANTQANVGMEALYRANLLIPPLNDQMEIAKHLDEKCNKIDSLISIKQQKIEKLNQYKKSVIYEYVTGKKEA